MKSTLKIITPAEAQELLEKNTRNRPVRMQMVRKYAKDMAADKWYENGETLKINGSCIVDGQHRLMACVMSGAAFITWVMEGVDSGAFATIDAGVPRSGGDTMAVMGEKYYSRLAAALAWVYRYETKTMTAGGKGLPNHLILDVLEEHPGIRDFLGGPVENMRIAPKTLMAALGYLWSKKNPSLASVFLNGLSSGADVHSGTPLWVLREKFIRLSCDRSKPPVWHYAVWSIKAWNATRKGDRIKYLKVTQGEEFPVIR